MTLSVSVPEPAADTHAKEVRKLFEPLGRKKGVANGKRLTPRKRRHTKRIKGDSL